MRQPLLLWISILLLIFFNTISAQDTLLLHYANATISEVILDDSTTGAITGKGDDASKGKYMFFDSFLHRSPETTLISILMDLEVSNFTELDSFSVFVEGNTGSNFEDMWEGKYSFSEIDQKSTPISSNSVAAYNFKIDLLENEIVNIGHLYINIGIRYNYESDAKIALRATGEGELPDALNRCFTINKDDSITDFVTSYGAEVGLAIFPVTVASVGVNEVDELGLEVIARGDDLLVIKSTNLSQPFNLSLFSLDGRLLDQQQLNSGEIVEINTSAFPPGIYIVNASNGILNGSSKVFLP